MNNSKVAIVTGAGQGIGKASALKLAERGVSVVIADINLDVAKKAAEEISKKTNVMILPIKVDIADENSVKEMVSTTVEKFGTVDVLVNNAGICRPIKDLESVEKSEWDAIINVNLMGAVYCCKAVMPIFKEKKYGKIINMASLAGENGSMAVSTAYGATKAGVINLTKSLAKQLGKYNITVNAIAPGLIATDMTADLGYDPETIPMKRLGTPEDVAGAVCFLESDDSDYITGLTIDVNGGFYLR